MSDKPSNAASEWMRFAFDFISLAASPPVELVRAAMTDDFTYEDRRSGFSFPDADAESYPKYIESLWQIGVDGQKGGGTETLAVRGERFAAAAIQADYGNGFLRENISVVGLDATLSLLQRQVDFDREDVDGAIAELDRMQSQADAS